jgi:U2 small nuclear ribonucleoprotein A'
MIENLAVTRDQFDCIDLSDNELRRLDNFPTLRRLSMLLASGNKINSLAFAECTPNLRMLVLSGNAISSIGILEDLRQAHRLEHLCLIDNPVTQVEDYRLRVIKMIPQLKSLDFQRITRAERDSAASLTKSLAAEEEPAIKRSRRTATLTPDEEMRIREALQRASTLEEISQLERILATGHIPDDDQHRLRK